ncbi:hypothetical protein M404DRAFT_513501 [Pisolithus tinctorius Marx 270]|uniref:Uncharacterized protein n=1 Tax=Pisolithus tinctorius Marx 270 TaxID=870435 RepID=A0A0C3K7U2_PISTI|nr:hypothetical protein M404DRAFT_513501 [Pisolithus tinctorius Marx 270]
MNTHRASSIRQGFPGQNLSPSPSRRREVDGRRRETKVQYCEPSTYVVIRARIPHVHRPQKPNAEDLVSVA